MLLEFTKSFLARIPISKLDWQLIEELLRNSADSDKVNDTYDNTFLCQDNILKATVQHPLNVKYPLPDGYIHSFLKCLINKVERNQCELHTEMLEKYTDLVSRNLSVQEAGHRTFLIDETTSISLKENISIISDGTTGLCTWQAAFYLAEWCICNRERIAGLTVVELGSGAGLVGLTCHKMCQPRSVTLTDFHPKVLETLRYNLQSNLPTTDRCIEIQSLDWVEFSKDGSSLPADVILASDVVYDVDLIPGLVGTLTKLLDGRNNRQMLPIAIVACTERNEETLERFLSELAIHNLTYKHLEHAPSIFVCERSYPVRIYEIQSIKS